MSSNPTLGKNLAFYFICIFPLWVRIFTVNGLISGLPILWFSCSVISTNYSTNEKAIFCMINKENITATNFDPDEYAISVQSTKIGTHNNRAMHSIYFNRAATSNCILFICIIYLRSPEGSSCFKSDNLSCFLYFFSMLFSPLD